MIKKDIKELFEKLIIEIENGINDDFYQKFKPKLIEMKKIVSIWYKTFKKNNTLILIKYDEIDKIQDDIDDFIDIFQRYEDNKHWLTETLSIYYDDIKNYWISQTKDKINYVNDFIKKTSLSNINEATKENINYVFDKLLSLNIGSYKNKIKLSQYINKWLNSYKENSDLLHIDHNELYEAYCITYELSDESNDYVELDLWLWVLLLLRKNQVDNQKTLSSKKDIVIQSEENLIEEEKIYNLFQNTIKEINEMMETLLYREINNELSQLKDIILKWNKIFDEEQSLLIIKYDEIVVADKIIDKLVKKYFPLEKINEEYSRALDENVSDIKRYWTKQTKEKINSVKKYLNGFENPIDINNPTNDNINYVFKRLLMNIEKLSNNDKLKQLLEYVNKWLKSYKETVSLSKINHEELYIAYCITNELSKENDKFIEIDMWLWALMIIRKSKSKMEV